jgi:hypothetical protein
MVFTECRERELKAILESPLSRRVKTRCYDEDLNQLSPWLQRINLQRSLIWNTVIGMIIVLSLLRWLLQR